MLVLFHEPNEFLSELERDPHAVARKLVRVTKVSRPAGLAGSLTRISVVATAKIRSGEDYDVVRLDVRAGDLWGHEANDEGVQERARQVVRELEERLLDLGFALGAGLYEAVAA